MCVCLRETFGCGQNVLAIMRVCPLKNNEKMQLKPDLNVKDQLIRRLSAPPQRLRHVQTVSTPAPTRDTSAREYTRPWLTTESVTAATAATKERAM